MEWEIKTEGARAGVSAASGTLGCPGVSYNADHPGYLCGCNLQNSQSKSEFCVAETCMEYCGVTIQTDTSSSFGLLKSGAQTYAEVVIGYYVGRFTCGVGQRVWAAGGKQILNRAWQASGTGVLVGRIVAGFRYCYKQKTRGIVNRGSSFVGRRGFQLDYAPFQQIRNSPAIINGRKYTGHAIDRMQDRGLTPSIIENAIQSGEALPNRIPNRIEYRDYINQIRVIVENDEVITLIPFKGKK